MSSPSAIANFKFYDDDKLAIVCSHGADSSYGNVSESFGVNSNNQSHLMILNIKSSIDPIGNHPSILLSYALKDTPAKLTVDGRSNLIAVVRTRLSDQLESSRRRKNSISWEKVQPRRSFCELSKKDNWDRRALYFIGEVYLPNIFGYTKGSDRIIQ